MNLTRVQRDVMLYVVDYRQTHGISPTVREAAQHFGCSGTTIHGHFNALIKKGALVRNGSGARNIMLAKGDEVCPLCGRQGTSGSEREVSGLTIQTTFAPGDTAWVALNDEPSLLTVGQVRVEVTNSSGINGGCVEPDAPSVAFDNYKPQSGREETYMMVETGIGCGQVFTLGKNVFETKPEAEAAISKAKGGDA